MNDGAKNISLEPSSMGLFFKERGNMNVAFLKLVSYLYGEKDLMIERLGLKIKNLPAETLAILLYPLLDVEEEKVYAKDVKLNKKRIKKAYALYKQYAKDNFNRVALIGGDKERAYNEFIAADMVYEDEYNQTIINKDGFYITLIGEYERIKTILKPINTFALIFSFTRIHQINGHLGPFDVDPNIFFNAYSSLRKTEPACPFLFFMLIASMGFTNNELLFIKSLQEIDESYHDLIINHANSVFARSLIHDLHLYPGISTTSNMVKKCNILLESVDIKLLKKKHYKKALKDHLK